MTGYCCGSVGEPASELDVRDSILNAENCSQFYDGIPVWNGASATLSEKACGMLIISGCERPHSITSLHLLLKQHR